MDLEQGQKKNEDEDEELRELQAKLKGLEIYTLAAELGIVALTIVLVVQIYIWVGMHPADCECLCSEVD